MRSRVPSDQERGGDTTFLRMIINIIGDLTVSVALKIGDKMHCRKNAIVTTTEGGITGRGNRRHYNTRPQEENREIQKRTHGRKLQKSLTVVKGRETMSYEPWTHLSD